MLFKSRLSKIYKKLEKEEDRIVKAYQKWLDEAEASVRQQATICSNDFYGSYRLPEDITMLEKAAFRRYFSNYGYTCCFRNGQIEISMRF